LDDNLFELEGVVDLSVAYNDDTTNFTNAKTKIKIKDTMAGKKDTVTQSTISSKGS
jgi:hypothetical protein